MEPVKLVNEKNYVAVRGFTIPFLFRIMKSLITVVLLELEEDHSCLYIRLTVQESAYLCHAQISI